MKLDEDEVIEISYSKPCDKEERSARKIAKHFGYDINTDPNGIDYSKYILGGYLLGRPVYYPVDDTTTIRHSEQSLSKMNQTWTTRMKAKLGLS